MAILIGSLHKTRKLKQETEESDDPALARTTENESIFTSHLDYLAPILPCYGGVATLVDRKLRKLVSSLRHLYRVLRSVMRS